MDSWNEEGKDTRSIKMGERVECPICAEPYLQSSFSLFIKIHERQTTTCCYQHLCLNCLYSHIHAILEEGITGDGRKKLACPFGCGKELNDSCVRACIEAKHSNIARTLLGIFIKALFFVLQKIIWFFWIQQSDTWILRENRLKENMKSHREKNIIDLYNRWSIAVALSSSPKINHADCGTKESNSPVDKKEGFDKHYVNVQRCPRPGCECLWLTSKPFREHKLQNERKFLSKVKKGGQSGSKYSSSLFQSASEWLFYVPPKPNEEIGLHGNSIETWLTAYDLHFMDGISSTQSIPTDQQPIQYSDGRYITCPACHLSFCGLCRRPWKAYGRKRISHTKISCCNFERQTRTENDFVHDAIDARVCPGCGILTNRSSGCNHIRCSCGYEWCYVCECKWNSSHYSCVDGGHKGGCVIF